MASIRLEDVDLGLSGPSDARHVKEVPLDIKVRWEAYKMSEQSPLDFDKSYGKGKTYKIDNKTVLPLRYIGKRDSILQQIDVAVDFPLMVDADKLRSWHIEVTVTDSLGGKSHKYTNADDTVTFMPIDGRLIMRCWVNQLMKDLQAKVNNNLITATVAFTATREDNGKEVSAKGSTPIPLHILLQKLIVLLPGVMASSLWVGTTKCFPGITSVPEKLRKLACGEDGVPENRADTIEFVNPGNPYATAAWEKLMGEGLPKLKVLTAKGLVSDTYADVPYYQIQGYPYDWRIKATEILELLFADAADVAQDYQAVTFAGVPKFHVDKGVAPPSIKTILKYWLRRPTSGFLHDRVSLMGHSTGGVLMNGIVRDARAETLIDKAFFVAAPFFGALKAYNAFLHGTMDLGWKEGAVLEKNEMLKLGKNLPVLYFLMPNAHFPYPVVEITPQGGEKEYYRADAIEAGMTAILDLADLNDVRSLRANSVTWNTTLAGAANDFVTLCEEDLQIPESNCVVFWSTMGAQSTIGTIVCDFTAAYTGKPEKRIGYRFTGGDATVPLESLKGPFRAECLCQITEADHLDHVKIITATQLWKKTSSTLGDVLPKD